MQHPSTRIIAKQFERLLQALPPTWKELLKELNGFTFRGKMGSEDELLHAIFLYCGADLSLKAIAADMTLRGASISDEAIRQRLLKCGEFIKALVQKALELEQPQAVEQLRFLSPDGTEVGKHFRVHLVLDLLRLQFVEVQVGSKKKGESLKNFVFTPSDVVVPDRGYCSYSGMFKTVFEDKAQLLIRWNHSLPLYATQEAQEPLDLCERLKGLEEKQILTIPVVVKYSDKSKNKDKRQIKGWLHAYRMTQEEAEKSERKTAQKHSKKQRKVSDKTKFLSQFILILTTLPPELVSAEECCAVYRCRWQIELAIKRLKSLVELNKLRALEGGPIAEFYIFGKILYLLMIDKVMKGTFSKPATQLDPAKRKRTPTVLYGLLKKALDATLIDMRLWRRENVEQALHVLRERPRKNRKLQSLPGRIVALRKQILEAIDDAA